MMPRLIYPYQVVITVFKNNFYAPSVSRQPIRTIFFEIYRLDIVEYVLCRFQSQVFQKLLTVNTVIAGYINDQYLLCRAVLLFKFPMICPVVEYVAATQNTCNSYEAGYEGNDSPHQDVSTHSLSPQHKGNTSCPCRLFHE